MKTKSFLLGAAAILLATACSNDEVVKVAENGAPIGFSSFINKSTRAKDNTTGTLENFDVYGVTYQSFNESFSPIAIFGGDDVTKSGDVWNYTTGPRYWIADNDYTFAAVAPAGAAEVKQENGTTFGGINTINFTNNGQVDLLYGSVDVAKGSEKHGAVVDFTLNHLLSRVRFEFDVDQTTMNRYAVVVNDIVIEKVKETATYTPSGNAWSDQDGEVNVSVATPTVAAVNFISEGSYLIPTDGTEQYTATFKIDVYVKDAASSEESYKATGETYNHTVTLPELTFEKNYSYSFKTTLNMENIAEDTLNPIEFKVEKVNDWTNYTGDLSYTTPGAIKNTETPTETPEENN